MSQQGEEIPARVVDEEGVSWALRPAGLSCSWRSTLPMFCEDKHLQVIVCSQVLSNSLFSLSYPSNQATTTAPHPRTHCTVVS